MNKDTDTISNVDPKVIDQIVDLSASSMQPKPICKNGKTMVVIPDGHKLKILEPDYSDNEAPPFRKGTFEAQSTAGFIDFIKRNRGSVDPLIAADLDDFKFRAILDWHADEENPDRCHFKATFSLVESPELRAWRGLTETALGQIGFADFIEDWRYTIVQPDAASLLEIVQDLQQTSNAEWKSKVTPTTGGISMVYTDDPELRTSKEMEVPKALTLHLPLFRGATPITITCNLRYRVHNGTLKIHVTLPGIESMQREAMLSELAVIKEEFGEVVEGYFARGKD